jgi:hypothetical protein
MDRLSEFLSGSDLTRTLKLLAIVDFLGGGPLRVSEIEKTALEAGLREAKNWNISQVLKRSGGAVILLPEGWKMTDAGRKQLRSAGWDARPTHIVNLIDDLNDAISKIKREERRIFLREAVNCYAAEHYRAAVVLSWSGAIAVMHDYVVSESLPQFNQEARRQGIIKKDAERISDLQEMKEHAFLQIMSSIGLLDKNQKQELDSRRQFRNACGHPSALRLSNRMVSAHLESLILNVFDKF